MNKSELIDAIAQSANITKVQAGDALNGALAAIKKSLSKDDSVTLVGFGTFKVVDVAERTGRNPQTGEVIVTPAKKKPKFVAGTALKEAVNRQS